MVLRLIEILVPPARADDLDALLDEADVVDRWWSGLDGERATARILARVADVEALSDAVQERMGGTDGLRVVILGVEATMPQAEEPSEKTEPGGGGEGEEKKAPDRVSREELYQDLRGAASTSSVYLVSVALSTVVAAVGLLRDDVAVIIGAMVIAPLLGPNVALSLAVTLGDLELAVRSLKSNLAGLSVALLIAAVVGVLVTVDPAGSEQLASRTQAGLGDLALALAAGSAGSLAYTTGLPTAIIGVMVAVALLPPLVAAGLFAGSGQMANAFGAAVLVATNVTCVNLAGVATFLARRVGPRTWWETEKAKKASRVAALLWLLLLVALVGLMLWYW